MTEESPHVEQLREVYGRWGAGDLRPTEILHPEIEVIWAPDMPDATVDHGVEALGRTMRRMVEAFEDAQIKATGFAARGDTVVVFVDWSATGRATGIRTSSEGAHVWTFDGDRAVRIEGFLNHDDGLRAAGIDPAG